MSIHYYKMANSNIFSNIVLTEYIKRSENNWIKISENFSNSIFSAFVSILTGIELWKHLDGLSLLVKGVMIFFSVFVLYILLNFFVAKLIDWLRKFYRVFLKKGVSEDEDLKMREFFFTELQPLVIMGLSLSQRILDDSSVNNKSAYKDDLDNIYVYQCLYFFGEVLELSIKNRIYEFDNVGIGISAIGKAPIVSMYQAIINQLKLLKDNYSENVPIKNNVERLLDEYNRRLNATNEYIQVEE